MLLFPCFLIGMMRSWKTLERPRSIKSLLTPGVPVAFRTRFDIGRTLLLAVSFGLICAGLAILTVGATIVFVGGMLMMLGGPLLCVWGARRHKDEVTRVSEELQRIT